MSILRGGVMNELKFYLICAIASIAFIAGVVILCWHSDIKYKQKKQLITDKFKKIFVDDIEYEYSATKTIEKVISVDMEKKLWRPEFIENCRPYRFDEIAGFEVIENGQVVSNTTAHNVVGRSLVGGLAFGEVGALIGGTTANTTTSSRKVVTSRTIRISVTSEKVSRIELPIQYQSNSDWAFGLGVPSNSIKMSDASGNISELTCEESAREIVSWLESMIKLAEDARRNSEENLDTIEQIKRYKQLCDDGIITEEEFAQKKKQLLGI